MKILSKEFYENFFEKQNLSVSVKADTNFNIFYENQKFENCFTNQILIGQGSFGKVYRVLHKLEGYYYAVKKINLEITKKFDLRSLDILKEISTMVNLQHKNIVRFITSWME